MNRNRRPSRGPLIGAFVLVALIVIGGSASQATLFPNSVFPTGPQPNGLALVDVNADGVIDMVVLRTVTVRIGVYTGEVKTFIGRGDGTFAEPVVSAIRGGPHHFELADLNGDNYVDLMVTYLATFGVPIAILPGSGDGRFGPESILPTLGDIVGFFGVGDFDGDGRADILAKETDTVPPYDFNDSELFFGRGDGTFAPGVVVLFGSSYLSSIEDFNGDGLDDLVRIVDPSVSIWLSLGNGRFDTPRHVPTNADQTLPGDFNRDGHLDLAVQSWHYRLDGVTKVFDVDVYLGHGDGTFDAVRRWRMETDHIDAWSSGDVNGDGILDIASTTAAGEVAVFVGAGDGTFTPMPPLRSGLELTAIAIGRVDPDVNPDLAVLSVHSEAVFLYSGHGDCRFGPDVLTISKTDDPDPVSVGNITYTINYSNIGDVDATGVVVSDTVPANTSFVSATGGGTLAAGVVTWSIGALNAGSSGSVQLVVQVASPPANGTVITNGTYSISSNGTTATLGDSITTTVLVPPLVVFDIRIDNSTPAGRGAAMVTWTTSYESDVRGFNLVQIEGDGTAVPLNVALIPCDECVTGRSGSYSYSVPKHRGGKDVFVEAVHIGGTVERFGPALKIQ